MNPEYTTFVCSKCGAEDQNCYVEPYKSQMLNRKLCWTCNFWFDRAIALEKNHHRMTIISGREYSPGNRTSGPMRGMAGRRFDIEYIEPSVYAGQKITTFDLWSGGDLPADLAERFCDTARFVGGAKKCEVGETTCWNPSATSETTFQPPSSLRPNKALEG